MTKLQPGFGPYDLPPPGACYVGMQISTMRALIACGMESIEAEAVFAEARRACAFELQISTPSGRYIVRRMRGGHAKIYVPPESSA